MEKRKLHFAPLILTAAIIIVDQLTKLIIIRTIPLPGVGATFFGDFFRIIHVRNLGAAFSIGDSAPTPVRILVMIIIPVIVIIGVIIFLVRSDEISRLQRWLLAGIAGGGIGNVWFDRIFRPLGVVDFLDFKFYGLFGLERWPTFNVADMSTVVSGVLLMITLILDSIREQKLQKQEEGHGSDAE
jgi:signal peptidase II